VRPFRRQRRRQRQRLNKAPNGQHRVVDQQRLERAFKPNMLGEERITFARVISPDLIKFEESRKRDKKNKNPKGFKPLSQKREKIPAFRCIVDLLTESAKAEKKVPKVPNRLFYLLYRLRPGPLPIGELLKRRDACIYAWKRYFSCLLLGGNTQKSILPRQRKVQPTGWRRPQGRIEDHGPWPDDAIVYLP
jgi:hypothetical protein